MIIYIFYELKILSEIKNKKIHFTNHQKAFKYQSGCIESQKHLLKTKTLALMAAASCGGGVRQHRYSAQQDKLTRKAFGIS